MKKHIFYLAVCLFAMLISAGCTGVRNDIPPADDSLYIGPDDVPLGDGDPDIDSGPVYRGVVTDITADGGVITFKLESPPGADYGYSSILVQSGADTAADFPLEDIALGDHLEVSFIDRNDGLLPLILSAAKLPGVADSVYNGVVVSYANHLLELEGLTGGDEIIFSISERTRLLIDANEIVPGARLNIYHAGGLTRSDPPMGKALEVRAYREG